MNGWPPGGTMGREIRRVPLGWEHPKDEGHDYIPLFDRSFDEAMLDYQYACRLWAEGRHPSQAEWPDATDGLSYEQWEGGPPDPRYYRVESWTEDDATTWVLYET